MPESYTPTKSERARTVLMHPGASAAIIAGGSGALYFGEGPRETAVGIIVGGLAHATGSLLHSLHKRREQRLQGDSGTYVRRPAPERAPTQLGSYAGDARYPIPTHPDTPDSTTQFTQAGAEPPTALTPEALLHEQLTAPLRAIEAGPGAGASTPVPGGETEVVTLEQIMADAHKVVKSELMRRKQGDPNMTQIDLFELTGHPEITASMIKQAAEYGRIKGDELPVDVVYMKRV